LDEQGNVQIADGLSATDINNKISVTSPPRSAAPGVKVVFSDGNGPKQTLYYFSTNLANGSFEMKPTLKKVHASRRFHRICRAAPANFFAFSEIKI
jgi:hypothetical protein